MQALLATFSSVKSFSKRIMPIRLRTTFLMHLQSLKRHPKPVGNKLDRIKSLRRLKVPIEAVVDIGVQTATHELIEAIPDKPHFLFEPVPTWYQAIKENYRCMKHTLYPIALSNQSGFTWLIQSSMHGDGQVTHASISNARLTPDNQRIVSCDQINVDRLDSFSADFPANYLLKIDVDGQELNVLEGASGCIDKASIIIIEADYSSVSHRALFVEGFGFQLIDIIDRGMYGEVLWQCDLVFIRNDLMNESLRPPMFDRQHWHPIP
ncbi:MAG: FkbM family methyltransferase [Cyanobacteria bacterium]|nr:FkbM family methyltransferase [Cyanobacteriota bacterium]